MKCSGPVSGGNCAYCIKKSVDCCFGIKIKPGPKRVEPSDGSRGMGGSGGGRRSAGWVSPGVGGGASAVPNKSTSVKVGGSGGSGGDARAVGRLSSPGSGGEEATSGVRPAAAGSLKDGGTSGGGGGGAARRAYRDGGSEGVAAANSNGTPLQPLALGLGPGLGEEKNDEVRGVRRGF